MFTLVKRQIPEFKPTGVPALDDALKTLREIEVQRADNESKIVDEVNARGGSSDELRKLLGESDKRHDALATEVRKIAEKLAAHDTALPMTATEKRRFSLGRVACAMYRADREGKGRIDLSKADGWEEAGFERDVLQQAETNHARQVAELRRTMGTIIDKSGGILVPSTPLSDWIELVRPKLVLANLGANYRPNLVGHKIPIFGLGSGVTAAWYGENKAPTKSEVSFKARYLEPHRLATMAVVSNLLLEWSPLDVQQTIEDDMAAAVAGKMEEGILFGAGEADAPIGAVNDPDVLTLELGADANTGGRFRSGHVPDFELKLDEADLDITEDAGFLFHPRVKKLLKQERVKQYADQEEIEGGPILTPAISDAALQTLLGYKFASTSRVPTNLAKGSSGNVLTYVLFALWRQLIIGQWGGMTLRVSKETGDATIGSMFLQNTSCIVMETMADGLMRRPDALVKCADALKTAA